MQPQIAKYLKLYLYNEDNYNLEKRIFIFHYLKLDNLKLIGKLIINIKTNNH